MFDLQADRPHELERLVHDLIRHLRLVDDVVQERLRIGRIDDRRLPLEQARHHFDARERVLDLVRDRGRHFAERHETVAQALALFELLDFREVLEKQRDTARSAALVFHVRQRVADHLVGRLEPQLGAVRQVAQLERAVEHAHDVRVLGEDFRKVTADGPRRSLELENSLRFRVDLGDQTVAGDRQHAVAHAGHELPKKAVGLALQRPASRGRLSGAGPWRGRLWHGQLRTAAQSSAGFPSGGSKAQGANGVPGATRVKSRLNH